MDAFLQVTDFYTLLGAWDRVRRNGGGAGGDGVRIEQFARNAEQRVATLGRALRDGTYVPRRGRSAALPKKRGGSRRIVIPAVVDRIVQTSVAQWLTRQLDSELEDASYGYRPGRSVQMAVARVAELRRRGYHWVVDADIEDFFGTVPHDLLEARLREFDIDPRIVDLIVLWLEHLAPGGIGLPQGSPISPVLSNLYLDAVDERIEARGVRLIRFADDFLLLCRKEKGAKRALALVRSLLAPLGLRLNEKKTRIVPFESSFTFLGHLFVRSFVFEDNAEDLVERLPVTVGAELVYDPAMADEEDDRLGDDPGFDNAIRTCYVVTPETHLGARQSSFMVARNSSVLAMVPVEHVDRVEVHEGASFSYRALRLALENDTTISIVNGIGETLGELRGSLSRATSIHLAQAAWRSGPRILDATISGFRG